MPPRMMFTVLGPVRAWRDDTELVVGPPQQRAVLAALLLAEGRHVSLDSLVDALWTEDPPRTAVGTVRTYISRLRHCLEAAESGGDHDVIASEGDGYILSLRTASLDLKQFIGWARDAKDARRMGDIGKAGRLLRDALGLWHDTPLAGVPGGYAAAQRARLAELRLTAVEESLALDIELGRHRVVAAELRALLDEHPLREGLAELLMLALYRSGRRADALDAFDRVRNLLRDTLGVDPGPSLREIHRRVLRGDVSLDVPRASKREPVGPLSVAAPLVRPAQLPPDLPGFTGRKVELLRLTSWADGGSLSPLTVVIDGMAGTGKSALAVHWGHRMASRFPGGQLYANLRGFGPTAVAMPAAEVLRGFLNGLGATAETIPDGSEAQLALYRSLMSRRRTLVVLDNARDADQVRPLLPGALGSVVLVTSRNRLTGLFTTYGARSLTVTVFSEAEMRDALSRRLGAERLAAEPEAFTEIVGQCAGLPLAMACVAARATVRRHLPIAVIARELRGNARAAAVAPCDRPCVDATSTRR